jgi:DNA-binding XRE family transcriptional regulator
MSLISGCIPSDINAKVRTMKKCALKRTKREEDILKVFAKNLKEARKEKGYSQEEFAHLVGFSRSYYTEIETGKRNVSLLNLIKIIETLKIDPRKLFSPGKREQ